MENKSAVELVDFPFPRAVSSPPLLVQVAEIDEESQKHEDQVELQSVGEAQRVSQHRREGEAEQTRLIKDGQGLDDGHRFSHSPERVQRDPDAVSQPR